MSSRDWKLTRVVVVTALVAVGLSACTPTEREVTMNYTDAVSELDEAMVASQQVIGGEWEVLDAGAEPCSMPDGTGARAPLSRLGGGLALDRQPEIIRMVSAEWAAAGFSATEVQLPPGGLITAELRYPESGEDENGVYLRLEMAPDASRVSGQTRCADGDVVQINEEYQKQQGN